MKDENRLIDQILKGDSSSFSYFVKTYQDMAMTIAYRIFWNKTDAQDVVQNAFVKAYFNLHLFQKKSKFSTWFYSIVYRIAITEFQKKQHRREDLSDDFVENTNLSFENNSNDRRELIEQALRKLPKDEAMIISLYYLEDYSVKEINEIMSLTDSNVKIKLFRARQKLKELLTLGE